MIVEFIEKHIVTVILILAITAIVNVILFFVIGSVMNGVVGLCNIILFIIYLIGFSYGAYDD